MNQTTYKPVLSIQVYHTYFKDGMMRGLQFVPVSSSSIQFQQAGIVIKQTKNGFQLFARTDIELASLLAELQNNHGITVFSFDITIQDPIFYNYTDLPLVGSVSFAFSSEDPRNKTEGAQTILHPSLHEGEATNQLGELHIAFDDLLALATNDAPASFAIAFDARPTQWCYYFLNASSHPLDGLEIANDAGIKFSDPVATDIENGDQALLMKSNVLIPLSDYGKYKFSFLNNGTIIIGYLPSPDASKINIAESDGVKWATSSIYIYL